ncbi:hypothetical protein [Pyrobaculum aerophilum]|uniref:PaREP5ab n=1 Tax=Pyrobaculum aerophilum TaxID=13773 RepID=A0A371R3C7_9CREN|nr:hypothetical protein [Pyrobaculum aerophilum]RFA96131.1 hypothetical protein CGL52_11390 [Pyrobaculum aerophilum]RFA98322.1 hypothetical protein CGL51_01220 [Pyrobaculum aerophilum]
MVNVDTIISSLVAQAPLVVIAIILLYYKLDRKIDRLDRKIDDIRIELGNQINELKHEIKSLTSGFYNYQNTLIDFLAAKGFVTPPEAVLLRGALRASLPYAMSKYYTEEVRKRLQTLLDKELDQYTWEDVAELENIAKLMYKEYIATGREDLLDYYPKLMMYAAIIRGLLRRREMEKRQGQGVA